MSGLVGYNEPFPTRDAIVNAGRRATEILARWVEQSLLQRVDSTPFRLNSAEVLANQSGTTSGTLGGDTVAGLYRVTVALAVVTNEPASSVELTLTWTYGALVRVHVFTPVLDGSVAAGEQGYVYPVQADPGTPISYTLTYVGATLTYDATLSAELVQPIG